MPSPFKKLRGGSIASPVNSPAVFFVAPVSAASGSVRLGATSCRLRERIEEGPRRGASEGLFSTRPSATGQGGMPSCGSGSPSAPRGHPVPGARVARSARSRGPRFARWRHRSLLSGDFDRAFDGFRSRPSKKRYASRAALSRLFSRWEKAISRKHSPCRKRESFGASRGNFSAVSRCGRFRAPAPS